MEEQTPLTKISFCTSDGIEAYKFFYPGTREDTVTAFYEYQTGIHSLFEGRMKLTDGRGDKCCIPHRLMESYVIAFADSTRAPDRHSVRYSFTGKPITESVQSQELAPPEIEGSQQPEANH